MAIRKKEIIFTLSILLLACFFMPKNTLAQANGWPFKAGEVENILDIIRKDPLSSAQYNLFSDSLASNNLESPRQAGAVALTKQAILAKQLHYWFNQQPKELSKKFLLLIIRFAPSVYSGDIERILNSIESLTVESANKYALDWLMLNQIKIGAGSSSYAFDSYKNNPQNFYSQYVLVYSPINEKTGKIIAEFYSNTHIEPPLGTSPNALGSKQDNPKSNCWPWDIWKQNEQNSHGNGLLEPFIVRVKGNLIKDEWNNFAWDKTFGDPVVEVDFDSPVPEISEKDDILSQTTKEMQESFLIEKILKPLMAKLGFASTDPLDILKTIGDKIKNRAKEIQSQAKNILKKIKVFLTQNPPQAKITELKNQAQETIEDASGIFNLSVPSNLSDLSGIFNLPSLIDLFDDIQEQTEILNTQAQSLLPPTEKLAESGTPLATSTIVVAIATSSEELAESGAPLAFVQASSSSESLLKPQVAPCPLTGLNYPLRNSLVFNEIAWMGTTISASNEWIELKNINASKIDLTSWQILDKTGKIKVFFENMQATPGEILLLERTDENSVKDIKANLIYSGALKNSEETLFLFSQDCVLQDIAEALPSWSAGSNTSKKTMERRQDLTWQTSAKINGTPKQPNSAGELPQGIYASSGGGASSPLETMLLSGQAPSTSSTQVPSTSADATSTQPTATSTPLETQPPADPLNSATSSGTEQTEKSQQIIISEIQIADKEFIEIYNPNNQAINLNSWHLCYFSSNKNWNEPQRNWEFSSTSTIPAKSHYLIGIYGYSEQNSNPNTDWQLLTQSSQPYTSGQISNTDGAFGIFSQNPSDTTSTATAQGYKIDLVNWGQTLIKQGEPASTPSQNQSLSRKKSATSADEYINTGNSQNDFELSLLNPINSKNEIYIKPTLPPISSLTAGPSANRKSIELFWQANTAKAYLIEYQDSYSNIQQILQTATAYYYNKVETAIISDLDPNQIYEFSVRSINQEDATSCPSNIAKAKPYPGFQDNNDNTITDLYTNLIWVKDSQSQASNYATTTTFQNAGAFISQYLNSQSSSTAPLAGQVNQADWRLPGFKELAMLIDFSKPNGSPKIYNEFSNVKNDHYWASSYTFIGAVGCAGVCAYPAQNIAQTIDFNQGIISALDTYLSYSFARFLAVRGPDPNKEKIISPTNLKGEPPQEALCDIACQDNEDNTLTDICSKLMWVKNGTKALLSPIDTVVGQAPGRTSWEKGVLLCAKLVLCNDGTLLQEQPNTDVCLSHNGLKYNDWRMPNILENTSGVNKNCPKIFPWEGTYNGFYWSSTLSIAEPGKPLGIRQDININTSAFSKNTEIYLQCVRQENF